MTDRFDPARDAAQQIVTARLNGDGETASTIAVKFIDSDPNGGLLLSLTLVDLLLYLHRSWGHSILAGLWTEKVSRNAWTQLMADVEEMRSAT